MYFKQENLFKFRIYINYICNIVFFLGIIACFLVAIFAMYKIYNSYSIDGKLIYYLYILFSFCLAIYFSFFRRLSFLIKVNTVLIILFTFLPLYSYEIYYEYIHSNAYAAKKLDVVYDSRSNYEFYSDLKKYFSGSNIEVFPNFRSRDLFHEYIDNDNDQILPLGGISNSITYFTNEAGFFPIIHTDRYGFANSNNDLYDFDKLDILLIGDSSTEGYSVMQSDSYASLLNKKNLSTISLGKSGSGSLVHLANLIEYAYLLKPKYVLWIYYDNDIQDLEKELKIDILKKYLIEDNFNQDLANRQYEIDKRVRDYFEKVGVTDDTWLKRISAKYESEIKILKLVNLRQNLGLSNSLNFNEKDDLDDNQLLNEFEKILIKADKLVSNWGGKLYFVYLPDVDSVIKKEEFKNKKAILNIAINHNIPFIDLDELIFKKHQDPLDLFPLRKRAHYNTYANIKIVEKLIEKLR